MESNVEEELDAGTCAKVLRANAQIDRGEGRTSDDVAADLRSLYKRHSPVDADVSSWHGFPTHADHL
jgi:hypothetical protein